MKVTLNIGLSDKFTADEAILAVERWFGVFNPKSKIITCKGDWDDEGTLVICFDSNLSDSSINQMLVLLAEGLTEDAIAYTTETTQGLAWNTNYTGKRYKFNPVYFTNF